MEVVSTCSLRVASLRWQPHAGMWALSLAVKATYRLVPGVCELAPQQEDPSEDDNYWNDDPSRSLYAPSDLVPFKVRSDVLLVGHAFAPRGEPTRSLTARLVVGDVDKSVEVVCDRAWSLDGQLREGARFVRMPLRYERAGGGPETMNPVGLRADAVDSYGATAIPNLQPLGFHVSRRGEVIPPVGFGPIAPTWPSRVEKLHHHAAAFLQGGGRLGTSVPEGIDLRFFNAAPDDQQLEELRSDARLVLENLHPQHQRLVTSLPGTAPLAVMERPGAQPEEVRLACDTLWIDTDRGTCALVWRGQVTMDRPMPAGRVVVSMDNGGGRGAWVAPAARPDQTRDDGHMFDGELTYEPVFTEGTVLPFAPAQQGQGPQPPRARAVPLGSGPAPVVRRGVPGDPNVTAELPSPVQTGRPSRTAPPPRPSSHNNAWAGMPAPKPPVPHVTPAPPPVPSAPSLVMPMAPPVPAMPMGVTPSPVPAMPMGVTPSSVPAPPPAPLPAMVPPAPPPRTIGEAAMTGAVGPGGAAAIFERSAVEAPPKAATPSAPVRPAGREAVTLLWVDPAKADVILAEPKWSSVQASKPPAKAAGEGEGDEDDALDLDLEAFEMEEEGAETQEVQQRRLVQRVLTRGEAVDAAEVEEALHEAIRQDGSLEAPLALVSGELSFPFDPWESLQATIAASAPYASDKRVKDAVEGVQEVMKTPGVQRAPGVAEALSSRVREAVAQVQGPQQPGRAQSPASIEAQVERMLVEQRAYQKRSVLGQTWIRSLLHTSGSGEPVPTYLPEALSKELPLSPRMRARVVAEVHPQQDPYEGSPAALKALAVARLVTVGSPRR